MARSRAPKQSPDEALDDDLSKGVLKPIYLLTGQESFLLRRAYDRLFQASVAGGPRGFNEQIFEAEKPAIFYRSWHYAGHVSQVAEPGQFLTVQVLQFFLEYRHTLAQRFVETLFFFSQHFFNVSGLLDEFRVGIAHLTHE